MPTSVCVLASGGFDSAVLIEWALRRGHRVHPVYLRAGLRWERAELSALRRQLRVFKHRRLSPLSVLSVDARALYGAHWSLKGRVPGLASKDAAVYLPGRNIILLSATAVFCARRRIPKIWIGTLKSNPFPDASPAFLNALSAALRIGLHYTISIETPFASLKKKDLHHLSAGKAVALAFSCLAPRGGQPCKKCNKCAEARRASPPEKQKPPRR